LYWDYCKLNIFYVFVPYERVRHGLVATETCAGGRSWRAKSGNGVAAGGNGKAAAPAASAGAAVPENVKQARDWIRSWRAKNLEKGLVKDKVPAK
jgi:hypothetical protein